jgi:hypothetical protein
MTKEEKKLQKLAINILIVFGILYGIGLLIKFG